MNCDQRQDLIMLHAVGALEETEQRELSAHLATGCVVCAGRLVEAEAVAASIPLGSELLAAPEGGWEKLEARIATPDRDIAKQADVVLPPTQRQASAWPIVVPWIVVAATLLAAVWLGVNSASMNKSIDAQREEIALQREEINQQSESIKQQRQEINQQSQEITRLRETVTDRDLQLAELRVELEQLRSDLRRTDATLVALRSPKLEVIDLAGAEAQPAAKGRILWDHENRVWLFYVNNMANAGADKTYELWFVTTDSEKIPAGTFNVDANGRAYLRAPLPPGVDSFALAAVTDEPAGGSAQPTGQFQLIGKIE